MMGNAAIPLQPKPEPARFLVLDIETGEAPQEAIARAIEAWRPPANLRDQGKIESRREEAYAKIRERAALLDASPILCVALSANDRPPILFNGMSKETPSIEGWSVLGCGEETKMLRLVRAFLNNETGPETVLVGHNLRAFDLPKLRHTYLHHRLRLPECLKPRIGEEVRSETVDTMALFRAFSMEHRDDFAISLGVVAETLGIPHPKDVIDGSQVPALHQAGEYQAILTYCAIDCATTARVFKLMTGFAEDLG
jgi:hypothetical protein